MLKLLFVFTVSSAALSPQTTWNGLRFRMNVAEAKRYLGDRGFDLEAKEGNEKYRVATPDYELKLPTLLIAFAFKPELYFDPSGLSLITLGLNVPRALADVKDKFATIELAAKNIHDALVTKYGPPVYVDGPCNAVTVRMLLTSRTIMTCEEKWKGDSQMIKVYWSYDPRDNKFAYFLEYQAQAAGL